MNWFAKTNPDEWDCRIDKWKGECKEIIQNGKCQLAKVEDKLRELEHDFDQKVRFYVLCFKIQGFRFLC